MPVFDWTSKAKTPIEVLEILLKPPEHLTTCRTAPNNVSHNVCFLVNVASLKSRNDWKSDDMGAWKNNGVQYYQFGVKDGSVFPVASSLCEDGTSLYTVKRVYYKNKSSPDLRKIVSILEGKNAFYSAC